MFGYSDPLSLSRSQQTSHIKGNDVELDVFDYFSFVVLGILITVFVTFVVAAGSLPGKIAQRRNHPQANAISVAAWISLLTLGALWPIAFVWAFTNPKASQKCEKEETRS
jgi:hypothetical protein